MLIRKANEDNFVAKMVDYLLIELNGTFVNNESLFDVSFHIGM
ncbi:hypothetical protein [Aneurinibacillus migulanus]|nr:hypothetical protein [Aneurinibacillus migulanus]